MKKLAVAALALAMTFGAQAQQEGAAGGSATATFGSITVASLTAIGVTAAVAAAIVSNSQNNPVIPTDPTDPTDPEFKLICNEGDGEPVAGVCTNNGVTVTVTGTGTATSTITVPVVTTYPAIVTRVN